METILYRDCLQPGGSNIGGSDGKAAHVGALPLDWSLAQVEKQHTLNVLQSVAGNKSEAARRLGVSRKTLERKISAWSRQSTPELASDDG